MKPIGQIFDELPQNYDELLEQIDSMPGSFAYAPVDFFNLEPFYYKFNSVKEELCNFYPSLDELPAGNDLFACFLSDGRLRFVRESISQAVHYDSFFEYSDNAKIRNTLYVNGGEVKPISAERLILEERGLPVLFESFTQYGYQRVEYSLGDDLITGKRFHGLNSENMEFYSTLFFHISESGEIEKIIEEPAGGTGRLIFEKRLKGESLELLLKQGRDLIVSRVVESLKKGDVIKNEIAFALFEYVLNSPFPPTVAFAQSREVEAFREQELSPLAVYHAPDLDYFSENENPPIDFLEQGESLFNEINSQLEEGYDYIEEKKIVFDAYLEISKDLKEAIVSQELLPMAEGFHVTARDIEECNEREFLEKLLSPEEALLLKQAMGEYEETTGLSPDERQFLEDLKSEVEREQETAMNLKRELPAKDLEVYYSWQLMSHLKPFDVETSEGKPNADHELLSDVRHRQKPDEGDYFEYFFSGEKIIARIIHSEEGVIEECYYAYDGDVISEYMIDESGILFQVNRLEKRDGLPHSYREVTNSSDLLELQFVQEEGRLTSCLERRLSVFDKIKMDSFLNYKYEYDSENRLKRITSCYAGDSPDRLVPWDELESMVIYSTDDSHVDRAFELATNMQFRTLCDKIETMDVTPYDALVLEWNTSLPFPIHRMFLLSHKEGEIHWNNVEDFDEGDYNLAVYRNAVVYAMESEDITLDDYILLAFSNLATKLHDCIKDASKIDLPVFFKKETESPEGINRKLS